MPLFPRKANQVGRRCPRLWRWNFRRWRHLIADSSRHGLDSNPSFRFHVVYHTSYQVRHQTRPKPVQHISPAVCTSMLSSIYSSSTASKAHHITSQHSTAHHSAISPTQSSRPSTCRSEPDNVSKQSWREPACRRAFYTALLLLRSLLFPFFFCVVGLFLYRYTAAVVCMSMLLSIYSNAASSAQHSTAQHSTAQLPLHKLANQVRAGQSTYQMKYHVCVHACGVRVVFLEHGTLGHASRLVAPKILDHQPHLSFRSILACEGA